MLMGRQLVKWVVVALWSCLGQVTVASPSVTVPTATSSPMTLSEIRSLMQAGHLPEAGQEILRQLQKPDPEPGLQLLQCVLQANQNQTDKAIACFSALVKARPDMLEVYNNLGVLHASLGQHEEAMRWFTLAMRRMPAMWTVHQNIQTLQVELSRKAYARALQAELPFKDTPLKLTLLAVTAMSNPVKPMPTLALPQSQQDKPRLTTPGMQPPVDAVKLPAVSATVIPQSAVQANPVAAQITQSEANRARGFDDETRQQLQAAVESWAKAWSSQNMSAYFAAYMPDFTPSKLTSRSSWEAERTARIVGRQFVRVNVHSFSFENASQKAIVRFSQVYESDSIVSSHRKRLDMMLQEGRWKIARETVITN